MKNALQKIGHSSLGVQSMHQPRVSSSFFQGRALAPLRPGCKQLSLRGACEGSVAIGGAAEQKYSESELERR